VTSEKRNNKNEEYEKDIIIFTDALHGIVD
jgi:hypothetical protein